MNYSCELILDLYPLYITGDLSPSVKKEVEEHLKECDACSSIYVQGEGFDQTLELEDNDLDLPKSLDERIQMRLKLRKWKMVVVILCCLILLIFINQYQDNRKELFITYEDVYRGADALIHLVETAPDASEEELDFLKDMYFGSMYEGLEQLTHTFNWLENQKYEGSTLFIEQQSFYTTLDNLNLRKQDGRWDEIDEQTYDLLKKYASEYKREVEEDYRKFKDGYSSYFETVDVNDLIAPIEAINKLTFSYNRLHQLPDEVQPLSEDEVKKRISTNFQVDPDEVLIEKLSDLRYRFTIQESDISGKLDAYTGYPIHKSSVNSIIVDGELLDVKNVKGKVTPEQGLDVLQEKVELEDKELVEKRNYKYIDTFAIYSSTSGGLVPVHAYGLSELDSTWRYINIETGKEELLFYEH